MARLKYLLTLTPIEIGRILRRRLPVLRDRRPWTEDELLTSSKHNRGIRFAELLLRQEAVLRQHMAWEPLNFEGRKVVEIGCGPLAGFGPLAIFCGAQSFESAEPEWNAELFFGDSVRHKYLQTMHQDLAALYGPRMSFDAFATALQEKLHIKMSGFERAQFAGPCDIMLSQSCLEHVGSLDAIVAKIAAIQGPQTRFIHLVDFGNHYPTENPFEGLYEQPPADYIARRGPALNMLRAPDIIAAFERAGIAARGVPSRNMSATYSGSIHPYWRERYGDEVLFTQLMIVAGPPA